MTSAENLASIEPWLYRTTPFADTWLSDTQTLTLALQHSLSSSDPSTLSPLFNTTAPTTAAHSGSGSDPDPTPPPRRSSIPVTGKPTKRRSRASKRATTTFITADPSNFRQMVQQVTGVQFSGGVGGGAFANVAVLKPEPQRAAGRGMQGGYLPTLDTSSYLLEQMCPPPCSAVAPPPAVVTEVGGGGGFDFESYCSFPTLESWKVM